MGDGAAGYVLGNLACTLASSCLGASSFDTSAAFRVCWLGSQASTEWRLIMWGSRQAYRHSAACMCCPGPCLHCNNWPSVMRWKSSSPIIIDVSSGLLEQAEVKKRLCSGHCRSPPLHIMTTYHHNHTTRPAPRTTPGVQAIIVVVV